MERYETFVWMNLNVQERATHFTGQSMWISLKLEKIIKASLVKVLLIKLIYDATDKFHSIIQYLRQFGESSGD